MKLLNSSSIYAIRALLYLDRHASKDMYTSISEMSEKLSISFHFLTKIMQTLARDGILVSHRGPTGGVMLCKKTDQIYLRDIIKTFEDEGFYDGCMLGLAGCSDENPCPAHDTWQTIKDNLKTMFDSSTIASLAKLEGRIGLEQLKEGY
ncbi:RrF2 family transcriptional regulator [Reichenbachiella ulvae]|uniref:Rrf2 family transcriptional regulator n=1 Tax=Reichenbachiella ulvae TaxID=2980104 RepID=A0ABT3CMX0_9BACT|nr:Rrf2 family transcriptional regulator [Reichenbachiella ulvae]MCV9385040.1 Rrf2 family transcriptional regulator [Reichenbachiella ulvae]